MLEVYVYLVHSYLCRWVNENCASVSKGQTMRERDGGISVFEVSVPLSSLSSEQRTALQGQPVIRPPAICSSSTHFFPSLLPGQRTPLQVQPVTTPSAILSSSTQTPCLSSLLSTSSDDHLFPGEHHVHNSYNTET